MANAPLTVPPRDKVTYRDASVPTNIRAVTSDGGVKVTWDMVFGAYGYDVRVRLKGLQDFDIAHVTTARYDTLWTENDWEWEYQVSTQMGDYVSEWSPIVSAVAHPKTPARPPNIKVHPI
jgi:hypothetical protein